ncbi:MAG TPA: MFS transporter [Streptosporangiaceae bacterium]|nr:MFS transporter [Streptosporangiaceae bacterium]
MLEALRIPDFRLLWGGSLISSLGSWLLVVAIPAHILIATGSLRDTGLTLVAEYLPPLVIGPVAGVMADRCDRRRLMITTNLFCAAAVASMLLGTSPGRYWVLYAALVAENSGAVLYAPAVQARTPAIVGTGPLLSSASAVNSATSGTVRLIGGPLGGILLSVYGIRWLIGADVLSYLLSAAAMFLTSRTRGERTYGTSPIGSVARDLLQGTRALRAQPVARALLPVTVLFLAANASLSAILIPFGIQRLGGSDDTGFLLSCLGAGFLIGAPVIRTLLDRSEPRYLLTATLAATAAAYYLMFTSSSLATALPAAAAVGMAGSMSLVVPQTVIQRVIPGATLGRVSAIFLTSQAAATLCGAVAGPFLAQAAHLAAAAITASLVTACAAGLAYLTVPRMPAVIPASAPAPVQREE